MVGNITNRRNNYSSARLNNGHSTIETKEALYMMGYFFQHEYTGEGRYNTYIRQR